MTPNWIATISLLLWPLVALLLYATRPVAQATIWTFLGAFLLLPVGATIKFEMIPALDKTTIPAVCALLGCLLATPRFRFIRTFGIAEVLLLTYLISPLITSLLNNDPIAAGPNVLPPAGLYDGISAVESAFLYILPYIIGREVLRTPAAITGILQALVVAGLIYSAPMLFEVRFSPQLHTWFYGYAPSQFAQSIRDGGFRPMVFLGHGLTAAFFIMTSVIAAIALHRSHSALGGAAKSAVVFYLGALLVFCKSLAAFLYAVVLAPVVRFGTVKTQLRISTVLVVIALSYPALRFMDLFPADALVQVAASASEERAQSLEFRFANENQLLARASERGLLGWGRYGRSRVYDTRTGEDLSTTDGRWIIVLGQFGVIGFIAEFGLLSLGVFRIARILKRSVTDEYLHVAAIAVIVSLNIVDLLPNSAISPWTMLLCGALLGRAEAVKASARELTNKSTRRTAQIAVRT